MPASFYRGFQVVITNFFKKHTKIDLSELRDLVIRGKKHGDREKEENTIM